MSSEEIVKVGDVPAHMLDLVKSDTDTGLDTMKAIRILNRTAIIQSNSPKEKKTKFGEGSICVPASEMILAREGESFDVVPVMFFEEFIVWNDRDDTASPMIHERSTDRASALSQRCQNPDPAKRQDSYGETDSKGVPKFTRNWRHHLNFICYLYSGEHRGELIVISFARSNWGVGQSLVGKIRQRKIEGKQAPMWSTVWSVRPNFVEKAGNEWYKYDVWGAEVPWVAADDLQLMKTTYEELLKQYEESQLEVGHGAAEDVESSDLANDTEM